MTQLDRIEAKLDSIEQMLFDLIQQLASEDDEENAPELDLGGNAAGRERGESRLKD